MTVLDAECPLRLAHQRANALLHRIDQPDAGHIGRVRSRHPANHGNRTIEDHDPADIDVRRSEQAEQVDHLGGTPTTPTLPTPMSNGMFKGAAVGAVVQLSRCFWILPADVRGNSSTKSNRRGTL